MKSFRFYTSFVSYLIYVEILLIRKKKIDVMLGIPEDYNFYRIEITIYGLRVSFIKCKNFLFSEGDEIFYIRWDYTPV